MPNPNFDTLVATTLKNYMPRLADNITNHQALLWQLKQRGMWTEQDGGTSIVEPLMIGRNTTVKSYSGYDIIDTSPQTGLTAAEFLWKQIAGTVSISGEELFKNEGRKTQVVSLLEGKVKQLEMSLQLEINRQLHGNGTGNGGKDITGLDLAVQDGTSAFSTYGGIDSSTDLYWRNQFISTAAITYATGGVEFVKLIAMMITLFNSCMRNNIRPTLIVTDQLVYEIYEKTLQFTSSNYKIEIDQKMGDAGFMNLVFKGTPMVFDDDMTGFSFTTTGVNHWMYMLNADFLRFVYGRGKNFSNSDWVKPDNQDAKSSQTFLYGNLTCNNRARQGRGKIVLA